MLPVLKSEFRKLYSVRSTYVIVAFSVLLTAFIGGFAMVYKQSPSNFVNPHFLSDNVANMLSLITIFCGIVAVLLFSHEYRYNTIMYTLTSTNRRSKVLVAKIVAVSVFAVVFTALMAVVTVLAGRIGVAIAGHDLVAQSFHAGELAWKGLLTGWAYGMLGLIFVGIARNQVFAFVAFFLIPSMVEPLLGILLKDNVVYLPFMALGAVLSHNANLSSGSAALVVLGWLAAGWIAAWVLFLRRDAN